MPPTRFRFLFTLLFFLCAVEANAQERPAFLPRKYPSLLWEIRGPGMRQPSYLIGTMHVSSKLAFNLPDSFFIALRKAAVVALETNPETWQDDLEKYDLEGKPGENERGFSVYPQLPADYLTIKTLKFYRYEKKIERALYSSPSTINSLLYRTYGNESSDFEEDTYLDMYIYQCGKKWGKRITGVEDYGESMRLMAEGYRDAAREKNRKQRSFSDYNEAFSSDKLQEAYRKGDLDLLDSITKYNSESPAFDEKFLYRRNEIQAAGIDSILRTGASLFVGVGAAHLPGERGVIELLRRKGYTLRPVKMGERASLEKERLERIRVPVIFRTESIQNGVIRVDVPGKLYRQEEDAALEQWQYSDMANGSYYMVTRLMTNAWCFSHPPARVLKKVDSLLYENIPGKIISRRAISRQGYPGFDITNRTRRGDYQRYQIFVTPFEVLVFKISGTGDYILKGTEAARFFNSIQLREYRNGGEASAGGWKRFQAGWTGFSALLPHEPYTGNDGSWIFDARDSATGQHFRIIRSDLHHFEFAGEDSVDLVLLQESFAASDFIDSLVEKRPMVWKGYPALEAVYRHKEGGFFRVRFIISGPRYYTLVAFGKERNNPYELFFSSFELRAPVDAREIPQQDTNLYFRTRSSWYPSTNKTRIEVNKYSYLDEGAEDPLTESQELENGVYRNRTIHNDSTGEKIHVTFFKTFPYYFIADSAAFNREQQSQFLNDSSWIIRSRKQYFLPNGYRVRETVVSDTGSSRALYGKSYYRDGVGYSLVTQGDTLGSPGGWVRQFFEQFEPSDSLRGRSPYQKKASFFAADFLSGDSGLHKQAVRHLANVMFDSTDLPLLEQCLKQVSWKEKNYLDVKSALIGRLGGIPTEAASRRLRHYFEQAGDTVQFQYAALENLLQQRTAFSFRQFGEIIRTEPPVLDMVIEEEREWTVYDDPAARRNMDNGRFFDELNDSLPLTRQILPDLLPLLNLDDYKAPVMQLLGRLVDSGLVKPDDYAAYYARFYLEARQELKRQAISEKQKAIEKAEKEKSAKKKFDYAGSEEEDEGNDDLALYARLLLPFRGQKPEVDGLIRQMLASGDKRLRYHTWVELLDKRQSFPDTLPAYFARLDEFRFELYTDLLKRGADSLFPAGYTQQDLARSALLYLTGSSLPDTLQYLDRLPADEPGRRGWVYFFRYKRKKDDYDAKLAVVGIVPADTLRFFYDAEMPLLRSGEEGVDLLPASLTGFRDVRIAEEEPLRPQLERMLKKILLARRKSGARFYIRDDNTPDEAVND